MNKPKAIVYIHDGSAGREELIFKHTGSFCGSMDVQARAIAEQLSTFIPFKVLGLVVEKLDELVCRKVAYCASLEPSSLEEEE